MSGVLAFYLMTLLVLVINLREEEAYKDGES